ncbi:hypothetical protein ACHAWU_000815 [Discostella pseudostelligera]|uniref:Uncharacterized protein n=1 Tax=Discostella pseudostelligera TaxID=259834 RepID=A0ABD3MC59_9STRA
MSRTQALNFRCKRISLLSIQAVPVGREIWGDLLSAWNITVPPATWISASHPACQTAAVSRVTMTMASALVP